MLNKEKYAKEIVEIAVNNGTIALKDNKPISCIKIKCIDCEQNVPGCGCSMKKLTEWANSEYKEPILTKEEKEYLRAVIKPFREKIYSISKQKKLDCEQITIKTWVTYLQNEENEELEYSFLPSFETGKMYKGMKSGKEYTIEELGL